MKVLSKIMKPFGKLTDRTALSQDKKNGEKELFEHREKKEKQWLVKGNCRSTRMHAQKRLDQMSICLV